MIAFYGTRGPVLDRFLAAAGRMTFVVVHCWNELERLAPGACCSVVLIERLSDVGEVAGLLRFQRRFPAHPVVLATQGCIENARHLRGLMVKEVVWVEEAGHGLSAAVTRTMQAGDLGELAAVLGSAQHLPRTLRAALVFACVARRPVYSVADLAASVHCNRTTLCLQWRKTLGEECTLRLVDFLALILLTHSGRRRSMGQKTAAIAADLGVHEHTLRRLAKRWGGSTSRRKTEHQQTTITGVFEKFVHTHLLRDGVTRAEEPAPLG